MDVIQVFFQAARQLIAIANSKHSTQISDRSRSIDRLLAIVAEETIEIEHLVPNEPDQIREVLRCGAVQYESAHGRIGH